MCSTERGSLCYNHQLWRKKGTTRFHQVSLCFQASLNSIFGWNSSSIVVAVSWGHGFDSSFACLEEHLRTAPVLSKTSQLQVVLYVWLFFIRMCAFSRKIKSQEKISKQCEHSYSKPPPTQPPHINSINHFLSQVYRWLEEKRAEGWADKMWHNKVMTSSAFFYSICTIHILAII